MLTVSGNTVFNAENQPASSFWGTPPPAIVYAVPELIWGMSA
jgi:hypothetical protein